jgi:hypothetical protein
MKRTSLLLLALLFLSISCIPVNRIIGSLAAKTSTPKIVVVTSTQQVPGATEAAAPTLTPTVTISCDDACLKKCIRRINDNMQTHPFSPLTDYAGTGANVRLVVYNVKVGQLQAPQLLYIPDDYRKYQQDLAAQQRIWNYAAALLNPDQLKWITQYKVFTDGPYNTMAWVSSEDGNRQTWTLGADIVDSEDPLYLTETLVHEFGHMITLNTDQIPYSELFYGWYQNPAVCKQFLHEAGCTNPGSYINLFYQKFWKDILEEWRKTVIDPRSGTPEEFRALVDQFYQKHSDLFVRDYAATNIEEDLAESFTHFVLEPRPGGKGVIEQKIGFFYDFPELVQMRQQIIQGMCSYQEP